MTKGTISTAPPIDRGYAWVVMVASFFNAGAMYGCIKTGGVLYVAIMNSLQVSRTSAAVVPSVAFSVSCLIGPLASSLSTRYSYRRVVFFGAICASGGMALTAAFLKSYTMIVICYGVIMGIGCGMVGTPNMIVVHTYFNRHRALASGFSLSGASVGGFLIPPLINWIIDNYGLFAALLTMSAIVIHICPMALLFRPLKQQTVVINRLASIDINGAAAAGLLDNVDSTTTSTEKKYIDQNPGHESSSWFSKLLKILSLDSDILHEKYFYMMAFGMICHMYAWAGYQTLLPDYALHQAADEVDDSMAALLLSYMCAGDVVFRIISGWLMDKSKSKRPYTYIVLLFASSIVMFGYTFTQPYSGLVASSVTVGILISGVVVLQPILLNDFIGAKRFPMALGIIVGVNGLTVLLAAPSLAFIRDLTGTYKTCFFLIALSLFLPACVWLIDAIVQRCRGSTIGRSDLPVEV